jgi:hypothetical protein
MRWVACDRGFGFLDDSISVGTEWVWHSGKEGTVKLNTYIETASVDVRIMLV